MDQLPVALVTLSVAAGTLAKILVDMMTMGWPGRPTWAAPLAALVFGIGAVFLLTVSTLPDTAPIGRQMITSSIVAGILAAATSIGMTAAGNTAETKRTQAQIDQKIADIDAKVAEARASQIVFGTSVSSSSDPNAPVRG